MIATNAQEQNRIPHKDYHANTANGKNSSPAFNGLIDTAVNSGFIALEQSEIVAPLVIDALGMAGPRTCIDFTRGKDAGLETGRREATSTINAFLLPGVYALGAGWLLTKGKGPNLFVSSDMVDALHNSWINSGKTEEGYIKHALSEAKGLVGNNPNVAFTDEHIKELTPRLKELFNNPNRKEAKAIKKRAVELLGAEGSISLGKANTNMKHLLNNIVAMGRVFKDNHDIGKIKRNSIIKSGIGIGTAIGIGFALQYINRLITSKETGTTAFVGLPDYDHNVNKKTSTASKNPPKEKETNKEKQKGLWGWKIAATGAMLGLTAASLVKAKDWSLKGIKKTFSPDGLRKIIEMKSKIPTLNHMKIIIGATLAGRMLAADDKYELKESSVRDFIFTFPFILVVGDLLSQVSAWKFAKKTKSGNMREHLFHMNTEAQITVADVEKIKNPFKKTMAILGLKMKTYGEMEASGVAKDIIKAAKGAKAMAVVTSILSSAVITGFGVPFLNKWMTNSTYRSEHRKKSGLDSFKKNIPVAQGFGV